MGGQVGDIGIIKTDMGTVEVSDTIHVVGGKTAHIGTVVDGVYNCRQKKLQLKLTRKTDFLYQETTQLHTFFRRL